MHTWGDTARAVEFFEHTTIIEYPDLWCPKKPIRLEVSVSAAAAMLK